MQWSGLDIGGAYLKIADGKGFAASHAFSLWKYPQRLEQEIRTAIAQAPPCDHLVVTMTGELADCFETKSEGVRFILEAVQKASDARHTRVYLSNGTFVTPQVALSRPLDVAAANWHALARFACRFATDEFTLLIDVGTTTCDLVPLDKGNVVASAFRDTDRLLAGELVYCGVERTPICALVESVPYRGKRCSVARELFATTRNVYLLLGDLPEDPASRHTADGRVATRAAARDRMGRMICADDANFNHKDAVGMAQAIADAQASIVSRGIERICERFTGKPAMVVISGQGEFLARRVLDRLPWKPQILSLAREIGPLPAAHQRMRSQS